MFSCTTNETSHDKQHMQYWHCSTLSMASPSSGGPCTPHIAVGPRGTCACTAIIQDAVGMRACTRHKTGLDFTCSPAVFLQVATPCSPQVTRVSAVNYLQGIPQARQPLLCWLALALQYIHARWCFSQPYHEPCDIVVATSVACRGFCKHASPSFVGWHRPCAVFNLSPFMPST